MKEFFLLDDSVVYLNHGSFGACLKSLFDSCQKLRLEMEKEPYQFFTNKLMDNLFTVRLKLGEYINSSPEDLVLIPNATYAINVIARSLEFSADDEIITTNHEYGACNNAWEFVCLQTKAKYVKVRIGLPLPGDEEIIEQIFDKVTNKTKVIFVSHISSRTAQIFPVAKICSKARELGLITVIDGAHSLGQIPINMEDINADFYFSNAHKWLCVPKSSAFLFVHKEAQKLVKPLITSWGWGKDRSFSTGNDFIDMHQWLGTADVTPSLTIPEALDFYNKHNWNQIRNNCHTLLEQYLTKICEIEGFSNCYSQSDSYKQMAVIRIPDHLDSKELQLKLFNNFKIEIPVQDWENMKLMRISVQAYNTEDDLLKLYESLR
ncbi:MAG: aminotransferase class V-fold PLP-dependent enzyme [Candidatus Cloacimonetes bacterium]|nr:aminotransferase class V-fold PLP-dependent enzyme [Candidatus Cloacimonadota bacterium]